MIPLLSFLLATATPFVILYAGCRSASIKLSPGIIIGGFLVAGVLATLAVGIFCQ